MIQNNEAVRKISVNVVDIDVHAAPISTEELRQYMPDEWRSRRFPDSVFNAAEAPIYVAPNKAQRYDSVSPKGGAPGSDPDFTEQQVFRDAGVDYAILIPLTVRPLPNTDHEFAVCSATNSWLAATWLSKYNAHGRYRGTIRICQNDPELAVREIEKWAGHPYFVSIMLNPYSRAPLGQKQFHPIYEAAARHDLPLCLHVNRSPGMGLLTPVGYASYFFEHHALYPVTYATHLTSMLTNGIFDKYENLRVAFIEGGMSWFVPLMWRLERVWKDFGNEAYGMRRHPKDYLKNHIRFGTQPLDEPTRLPDLKRMLEWMDGGNTVMFSTDYPHWDFDDPHWVLDMLPGHMRANVLAKNALDFYKLPPMRADLGPSASVALNLPRGELQHA
ncbi:putative metal-dependent hydrolase of the TIM-barrel fold OS=Afipia felis OX=1035 GN=NCTC12722_03860 PE=4 SV=1 [Afipia felis]